MATDKIKANDTRQQLTATLELDERLIWLLDGRKLGSHLTGETWQPLTK